MKISVFTIIATLTLLCAGAASAQDFRALESLGLYETTSEGSLGRNLWKGSSRADLIALIDKLPANPKSKTLYRLQKHALLSSATADFSKEGSPKPGQDFLTARMEKLIDMGAYQEAHDLYRKLDDAPYHKRIGELGILALLYTGEKALACIEAKILRERLEDPDTWKDLIAYCNASLTDNPKEEDIKVLKASPYKVLKDLAGKDNHRLAYKPADFEVLSWTEQAVLVADDRLDLTTLKKIKFSSIPTRHLPALLQSHEMSEKDKTRLTMSAIRRGAARPEALAELYTAQYKPAAGEDEPKAPKSSFEKLSYFQYQIAQAPRSERWALVQKALSLTKTYSVEALTPLAPFLVQLRPENPSAAEIESVLRIFYAAGETPSQFWLDISKKIDKKNEGNFQTVRILSALSQKNSGFNRQETLEILGDTEKFDRKSKVFIKNIIENLDTPKKAGHNALIIYEKDFDIASQLVYKMPQLDVWDRLKETSQNQNKGETILLSAAILHASHLRDLYPGFLRDVFSSLNAAGFETISRDLAIEAYLEG